MSKVVVISIMTKKQFEEAKPSLSNMVHFYVTLPKEAYKPDVLEIATEKLQELIKEAEL